MFLKYIDKNDIYLILFENNPENALSNCLKRYNDNNKNNDDVNMVEIMMRGYEIDNIRFSNIYNLDNYKDYNHKIIKVPLY